MSDLSSFTFERDTYLYLQQLLYGPDTRYVSIFRIRGMRSIFPQDINPHRLGILARTMGVFKSLMDKHYKYTDSGFSLRLENTREERLALAKRNLIDTFRQIKAEDEENVLVFFGLPNLSLVDRPTIFVMENEEQAENIIGTLAVTEVSVDEETNGGIVLPKSILNQKLDELQSLGIEVVTFSVEEA